MTDGNSPELSRVDAKIKRDTLLRAGLENLWDSLWEAVQATCKKVNAHWNAGADPKRNDGNSVIRVTAPPEHVSIQLTQPEERQLELRLDRREAKMVARMPHRDMTISYPIKADHAGERLLFNGSSPLYLAEFWIAERLLGLNLES